jgi:hypothetical protein
VITSLPIGEPCTNVIIAAGAVAVRASRAAELVDNYTEAWITAQRRFEETVAAADSVSTPELRSLAERLISFCITAVVVAREAPEGLWGDEPQRQST